MRRGGDNVIPISQGRTDDRDNLQALCSTCNQGKQNIQAPTESALNILARVRKPPAPSSARFTRR